MKQRNSTKYYFNHDECLKFVDNNVNDECWFADCDVVCSYFEDVVTKLVVINYFINIKKVYSSLQKLIDIELKNKKNKRFT